MTEADPYAPWRAGVRGDMSILLSDWDNPQVGFYRRLVGQAYQPVAIWIDAGTGEMLCMSAGSYVDVFEVWQQCMMNPTSEAAFRAATDEGESYPDEIFDSSGDVTRDLRAAAIIRPRGKKDGRTGT